MSIITTTDGTEIYYKDWGTGQPIVFSHGWPLSSDDWDNQMFFFLSQGYRVIAHDRRGHGRTTQTPDGHGLYADLQELSRGIHPAILSRGGLGPAIKTLARRSPVPVDLDVEVPTPPRIR